MSEDPNAKRSREEWLPLIPALKKWLGEAGTKHFKSIKAEHGRIDAIWDEGGIPHVVHFREGMQIRNKLRDLTNGAWTSCEYDNTWKEIIEEAIL